MSALDYLDYFYQGMVLAGDDRTQADTQYILIQIIGSGNNADIWMACALAADTRIVAIKIQNNLGYKHGCREVEINSVIRDRQRNDAIHYCITMIDNFTHTCQDTRDTQPADDAKFVCSVYNMYAGNLAMLFETDKYKNGFDVVICKKIIKRLLHALHIAHSCGIIHTDVKPENILLLGYTHKQANIINLFQKSGFTEKWARLRENMHELGTEYAARLQEIATETILEIYESAASNTASDAEESCEQEMSVDDSDDTSQDPQIRFNTRRQSVDDYVNDLYDDQVYDLDTDLYDFENVLSEDVADNKSQNILEDGYVAQCCTVLADFGNACFYDNRTRHEIQDRCYRAPEIILGMDYSQSCDIWSVACTAYELLTGAVLFDPANYPVDMDKQHLYLIEKMLGKIPEKMKKWCPRSKFLFSSNRDYHIKNVAEFNEYPLEDVMVQQHLMPVQDARDACEFMMAAFEFDASKRPTAAQLLNHAWLSKI